MKKTALVIGNSGYTGKGFLKNPINDALDISNSLKKLGFSVILEMDANNESIDRALQKFEFNLNKNDIGLFYFAGHGVQVGGVNYLIAIDSKTKDETALKHSSTSLNQVLDIMDKGSNETNIIILDACRDNPFERAWNRDNSIRGFANVFAPKGTIISFSTSPGQYASDGLTNNSPFAYALLTHIQTPFIAIEELFKRVRETVMASTKNAQISWEHTSLVGNFQFNSGNFISVDTGYTDEVVADRNFEAGSSDIEKVIEDLKHYDWYIQNPAVERVYKLKPEKVDKNLLFLLGRNLLQAATGNARRAISFIQNTEEIKRFHIGNENHLLNGIFFEIYFDAEGKFRLDKFKARCINEVFDLYQKKEYKESINFIREQLLPFKGDLFILPNIPIETISMNFVFEVNDMGKELIEIQFEGRNILQIDKNNNLYGYVYDRYDDFCQEIALALCLPIKQVAFTNNIGLSGRSKIALPSRYDLNRINNP